MKALVNNSSSKKQVASAQRKERFLAEEAKNDLKVILKMPEGQRFVWNLLSYCGLFRSSIDHSGSFTYVNEGRREVGLFLLSEITAADPISFPKMMEENLKKELSDV